MSKVADPTLYWAVLTRPRGEVLTAEAESPGLHLGLLGVPKGLGANEAERWLYDVAGVAHESSPAPGGSQPIPALLHHALTGLLFSHGELWERPGSPRPCSFAFTHTVHEVGFGWVGDAEIAVWVDGEPWEPQWVGIRDESGREARAWRIPENHSVQVRLRWASSPDGGSAPGGAEVEAVWTAAKGLDAETADSPTTPMAAVAGAADERPAAEQALSAPALEAGGGQAGEPQGALAPGDVLEASVDAVGPTSSGRGSGLGGWLRRTFSWMTGSGDPAGDETAPDSQVAGGAPAAETPRGFAASGEEEAAPIAGVAGAPESGRSDVGSGVVLTRDDGSIPVAGSMADAEAPADVPDLIPPTPESPTVTRTAEGAAPRAIEAPEVAPRIWRGVPERIPPSPEPAELTDRALAWMPPPDPHMIELPPPAPGAVASPDPVVAVPPSATIASVPGGSVSSVSPPPVAPQPATTPATAEPVAASEPSEPATSQAAIESTAAQSVMEPAAAEPATTQAATDDPAASPAPGSPAAPAPLEPATTRAAIEPAAAPAVMEAAPSYVPIEPATGPPPTAPTVRPAATESAAARTAAGPAAQGTEATHSGRGTRPRHRVAPPQHPAWPTAQQLAPPAAPFWKRPWAWVLAVAVLFVFGWLVGAAQDPGQRRDANGGALSGALRALGLGGPRFVANVTSRPPGAWISVDDKTLTLRTPAAVELTPGEHTIGLSFPDLGGASYTVRGLKGERVPLDATLWGALEVFSPNEVGIVSVAVDGETRGFAPLRVENLTPGVHEVRFSGPGMASWGQTVDIRVGETKELLARATPSPASGVLQVQASFTDEQGTQPLKGGQVWIDGEPRGTTPLTLDLPRGPHSVRLVHKGQQAPIQVIDLPGGNQRFAVFEFGLDLDVPQLLADLPPRISRDRPTVVSASLDGVAAGEVREMWLHAQIAGGPWRRYAMTLLKASPGVVGVAVFPRSAFDAQGRARFYLSAQYGHGDESFTEIRTVQLEKSPAR